MLVRKKNILLNAGARTSAQRKALLYYKTDPFFSNRLVDSYEHPNNKRIILMINILSRFGYSVDVIDRCATWGEISRLKSRHYHLYISDCSANTTPYHCYIMREFHLEKKIILATIMHADRQNQYSREAQDDFARRHPGVKIKPREITLEEGEKKVGQRYENMDAVIYMGNDWTRSTYSGLGIPCYPIVGTTSPRLEFRYDELPLRRADTFLFCSGSGLVQKGLDLVIDAFLQAPTLRLEIMAPEEEQFWNYFRPVIRNAANIRFHGFVRVASPRYDEITARAGFVISPSLYDGASTSVSTAMRKGLIPIVTPQTGIDIDGFGILILDRSVPGILKTLNEASSVSASELHQKSVKSYERSWRYTEGEFIQRFEFAINDIARDALLSRPI